MEALFPLLIFWLIVGLIGKLKKAPPQQQQQKPAVPQRPAAAPQPARPAAASRPSPAPPTPQHTPAPFEAHMHTPVMGIEGVGTEGEDCCHEFMMEDSAPEESDFLPLSEEDSSDRSRALLQGVIYSEILGRRPQRRYGGSRS